MKIIKRSRDTFNTQLIETLEKKYPKCDKKTNIEYKRNLDYIAYYTNFHETDDFQIMILKGYDVVLFYQFIRERIGASDDGYKYEVTQDKLDMLIWNACHYLHMEKERAKEIYQFLIDKKILIEIDYNNGKWILDEYSVWNFEIINSTRVNSRKSTAKSRTKKQQEEATAEQKAIDEFAYDLEEYGEMPFMAE